MLDFVYTMDYDDGTPSASSPSAFDVTAVDSTWEPLTTNAQIYVTADIYDIPELKQLATEKYRVAAQEKWNTPYFSKSLQLIYDNTRPEDKDIKKVALEIIKKRLNALLDRGEFTAVLKENGELAFEVLRRIAQPPRFEGSVQYQCRSSICGGVKRSAQCSHCRTPFQPAPIPQPANTGLFGSPLFGPSHAPNNPGPSFGGGNPSSVPKQPTSNPSGGPTRPQNSNPSGFGVFGGLGGAS